VRFHDGPADGQTEAQALGFGRVEGLEEAFRVRRQAVTFIPDGGHHSLLSQHRRDSEQTFAGGRWQPWHQPR